ncbi:MAG: hypothetical protein KDI75_02970 [Xanthomonadales bacterium]|nr:hypothetical protein [Xanthomonadales bacterium]
MPPIANASTALRSIAAVTLLLSSASCPGQATRFRIDDMALRDPHIFVNAFSSCADVTDTPILTFSVNGELAAAISEDRNDDGLLDYSSLLVFQPLNHALPQNPFSVGTADCTAPLASTACGPLQTAQLSGPASLPAAGSCLEPIAGSLNGYLPPVASSTAPCFASTTGTLVLDLGGIPVSLQQAQVAASFDGNPADGLVNGLMRGFISEADADTLLLPDSFPLVGGQPLSSLLPGGSGNCATHDDRDVVQAEDGWWFYLNFSAARLDEAGAPDAGIFANGFED